MSKARSNAGKGKGWHLQSQRHSRARKYGRAGGTYSKEIAKIESKARVRGHITNSEQRRIDELSDKQIMAHNLKNKSFGELKKEGVFLKYQGDADKDGTPNIRDCKPLDAKRQGRLHDMQIKILKKIEERQEQRRLAEIKKLEDLKEKLQQVNMREEDKNKKLSEKRAIVNEIEAEKQKTRDLIEENRKIKEELSKNRVDKKILRKSKEFLQKPSTKKAIRKGLKGIKKELKTIFS